ncbi:TonB-dependent receptor [Chitinophaga sp. Cy-1792]|nr:TonB-dependent receptor [Chitinophaga sp. Cy-1792]
MSILMTLLLVLSAGVMAQNNTGSIKGNVVTSDGQAGSFANIQMKGTGRGTVADIKGDFNLRRLEPGKYILQVSIMGYTAKEEEIDVTAGKTAHITIKIQISDKQLKEVNVTAAQNKFATKESPYIAKLPISNIENPQVYSVVGSSLIKEQQITNFDDIVKNVPGISKLWSSTGRPGDGAGYYSLRGFSVQPTMINGIPGLTNGVNDPAYIDGLEIIKGPSGTLYGSSLISFGGLINLVTKKPYDSLGGEFSYTGGGYGLSRITGDVNAPLNQDKSLVLRTIAAYQTEGTWQDAGLRKSFFFAPSIKYRVNDKLTFNVNAVFNNMESTNVPMIFLNRGRKLEATTPDEFKKMGFDFNRSFTANDITYKTPTINLQGVATYKISDKWTSVTSIAQNTSKSNGYYSYVMFLGPHDDTLSRYVYHQNSTTTSTDIQQNFMGDFKIGSLRNRVVIGLDFMQIQQTDDNSPYTLFDRFNALLPVDPSYSTLNRQAVDRNIAEAGNIYATKGQSNNYTYSAYISDVLNITDRFIAMASLRADYYDYKGFKDYISKTQDGGFNQFALSPKFGLVYEVIKDKMSVFGNYMNGFQNAPPQPQPPLPELRSTFKPMQANQWEGGVKTNLLNGRLNLTASYYDITVNNMTMQQSYTAPDGTNYNYQTQNGKQNSKGFEFEGIVNPIRGLNIVAGYSHNISKTVAGDKKNVGYRPEGAGPADLANLWISYTAPSGKFHGLGAGFGGNYAGENLITNNAVTGTFTLPSYTVLGATVFYDVKKYRLAVKLDNLTNKEYFTGWSTIEQQMPRRFSASAAFRF